jgi:hypothetical protein
VVQLGLLLTYLSAAMIPWTAVNVGTIAVGEIVFMLGGLLLLLADLQHRLFNLPPWVWTFAAAVLITGLVNQFAPPSMSYLALRGALSGGPEPDNSTAIITNVIVMVTLFGRVVMLPLIFTLARSYDDRALFRASMAMVAGCSISAMIAFTDSRGITSIGPHLVHLPVVDRRAGGLTNHPNVVAMGCVLALPLAAWQAMATRQRRERVLAVLAILALLLGLYASRSRSGAGAAGVAGLAALFWLPQYRRRLPIFGLIVALVVAVIFAVSPDLGSSLLTALRLNGSDTTGADNARNVVNEQAVRDWMHSPIHGIGLEVADDAHIIYLQVLAVGGIILLIALVIYQLGALFRSARLARVEALALPLFVSVLAETAFNTLQNTLTPSLAYLAPSLVAALPLAGLAARADDTGPPPDRRASVLRAQPV